MGRLRPPSWPAHAAAVVGAACFSPGVHEARENQMVALRSRRLEAMFGDQLSDVTAGACAGAVANAVQEDFDLDFKAQMYGNGDAEKRDLAADVAAMANSAGGVIVLGVEENEHAQASAAPGIAISDEVERRILQVYRRDQPGAAGRRPPDRARRRHTRVTASC